MDIKEIIFVYNADSTLFAAATDFVKKLTTPEEYECNLCMVTYGTLTMKSPWKEYLDTLPYTKTFLHRDEFREKFPVKADTPLPTILYRTEGASPDTLVHAEELNEVKDIDAMKSLVERKLTVLNNASS